MEYRISEMIAPHLNLSEQDAQYVDEMIPVQEFKKGELLLREGQVARNCYFAIKGCVRAYQLIDGEERNTSFYLEEEAIAPLTSYLSQSPANHYLECLEDSVLAVLNYNKEKKLYQQLPDFEALCRLSIETEFGKQQQVLSSFLTKSPEERYLFIRDTRPELLHRIPQYHLASYLGVQPESLSRIRKRIARKDS